MEINPGKAAMDSKIELQNVSVGYLTEAVIKGLSLEVGSGELVGIYGPNGAGKTTLLCAVNGLAVQSGGSVYIDGRRLTVFSGIGLRKRIGFVPQHFDIDPRLPVSAREVLLMGRYGKMGLFRFAGRAERKVLEKLVDLFQISGVIDKPFGQLSGGEKKRVLIARALAKEPEIMLLDEIFAWLDQQMHEKLIELIKKLHDQMQLTTMIVTHNLEMIERLCTRVLWMQKGEVVCDAETGDFLRRLKS